MAAANAWWGRVAFYTVLCYFLGSFAAFHSYYAPGNLDPAPIPFDEVRGVLAQFPVDCANPDACFYFGLATAPAHVEDELDDTWLEFARATSHSTEQKVPAGEVGAVAAGGMQKAKKGKELPQNVPAWHNQHAPHDRLRFWTEPEVEIDLAAKTGVRLFRLGVDWGRLVPVEPVNGTDSVLDRAAVERYVEILTMVRARGMEVMLTLWHHSAPKWAAAYGGWTDKRTVNYFLDFTRVARREFGEHVRWWVTFNEAHLFCVLTYCVGAWPPGHKPTNLEAVLCFVPLYGAFFRSMRNIIDAHDGAYNILHADNATVSVGIAHFAGIMRPRGLFDVLPVMVADAIMRFGFPDSVVKKLDFLGLNYYGQEVASNFANFADDEVQYSDAGRGVFPDGLYHNLVAFHKRYSTRHPNLRFMVTENGIADASDVVRPSYLIEHILAIHAARIKGVPVDAYVQWTISDNWEWADGYCPKFGLVAVDRHNNLTRTPRPSYGLFSQIAGRGQVTRRQRAVAWEGVRTAVERNGTTHFCRVVGKAGDMYEDGLHEPVKRPLVDRDWRFGHYKMHKLDDPVSRFVEAVGEIASKHAQELYADFSVHWESIAQTIGLRTRQPDEDSQPEERAHSEL